MTDFEASYAETPPWDIGRPQPSLAEVELVGRVLDVGCGTGERALMAASRGFEAVGLDAAPTAIRLATEKAAARGLSVRFVVGDALDLASLGEQFDTVIDCGLFHVFDDGNRAKYVSSLTSVVPAGGRLYITCFSENQPGDWGPRRVTQEEIRTSFANGWRVDAVDAVRMPITILPDGIFAWRASLTRV
jgi:cyclopropane fatty-acyl-phospholipid synthase-like methyltransferase